VTHGTARERRAARGVVFVWMAGAAVRLALLSRPDPWFDEGTSGLLGLAVLRGRLPIYFRMGVHAVRFDFAPVTLRTLRVMLARGDPVFDWSVHELAVYEVGPSSAAPAPQS
jgi:hypothetical protein